MAAAAPGGGGSAVGSDKQKDEQKRDLMVQASFVRCEEPLGSLATFNATHGYQEARLRGFRSGFLTAFEYRQLAQCTSLDDVKLVLADTDLVGALTNVQGGDNLTADIIHRKAEERYFDQFHALRDEAVGPLATFLDMITYPTMISNITFLIASLIRGSDNVALLSKCHPLGMFPGLKTVFSFENSADGLAELYRTVLIETPVARYFSQFFDAELRADEPLHQMEVAYTEVELEIIQNMLQKLWLEDFHRFCKTLGGETASMMETLLGFEADRRTIAITINSFHTALNDISQRDSARKALYPKFGKLYPEGHDAFTKVGSFAELAEALKPYKEYSAAWAKCQSEGKPFQEVLKEMGVRINRQAFDSQGHFACFYAYHHLKLQEHANLFFILSCITEKRDQKEFARVINIF